MACDRQSARRHHHPTNARGVIDPADRILLICGSEGECTK